MNTLKTAALTVVLLGVLYGVYVSLNKPYPLHDHRPNGSAPAAPLVEFGPAELPPARAVPPSATPPLLRGHEENPADVSNSRAETSPYPSPRLDPPAASPAFTVAPTKEATEPGAASENTPVRRSTYESPAQTTPAVASAAAPSTNSVTAPPASQLPDPPTSAPAAAVAPVPASSSGGSPALAAWSLRRDWQEVEQLASEGKFKAALAKLSPYYSASDLDTDQRAQLMAWLDALAAKVIYSREHLLAPAHQVRKGETLMEIADQHKVPWRLLANINGDLVSDTMVLVPGTSLKVVPGPFRADVNLAGSEMTLFLGELYAGHFPLALGDQPPAPGQYKVLDKMSQQKSYYGLDGRVIPANDPTNPFGAFWLSLGGEVAIHGSPAAPTAKTLGCISLSPQDAKDVYSILAMGSEVTIRR